MTTRTITDPRRIKAKIEALRDQINSITVDPSPRQHQNSSLTLSTIWQSLSNAYCLLMSCELFARGVDPPPILLFPNSSTNHDCDAEDLLAAAADGVHSVGQELYRNREQLLNGIAATAGKPLIDPTLSGGVSSPLPDALLAAMVALCGIAAEKCAELSALIITTTTTTTIPPHNNHENNDSNILKNITNLFFICFFPHSTTTTTTTTTRRGKDNHKRQQQTQENLDVLIASAIQRCMDVKDDRLLSLLQISKNFSTYIISKDFTTKNNNKFYHDILYLKQCFLCLAKKSYLYAAHNYARDQPQMWRKALDVILLNHSIKLLISNNTDINDQTFHEQHHDNTSVSKDSLVVAYRLYHTKDAVVPLQHLARITLSKNNEKKSTEWTLRLIEAMLGYDHDEEMGNDDVTDNYNNSNTKQYSKNSNGNNEIEKLVLFIDQSFNPNYDVETTPPSAANRSNTPSDVLNSVNISIFDNETDSEMYLLYKILQFRVALHEETTFIHAMAHENFITARNRSTSSTTTTANATKNFGISLDGASKSSNDAVLLDNDDVFIIQARRKILLGNINGRADVSGENLKIFILDLITLVSTTTKNADSETNTKDDSDGRTWQQIVHDICHSNNISFGAFYASLNLLTRNILRLVHRAQATGITYYSQSTKNENSKSGFMKEIKVNDSSKKHVVEHVTFQQAWDMVYSFISPIITYFKTMESSWLVASSDLKSVPAALRLVKKLALTHIQYCWMRDEIGDVILSGRSTLSSELEFVVNTLLTIISMKEKNQHRSNVGGRSSPIFQSSKTGNVSAIDVASEAARCRVMLLQLRDIDMQSLETGILESVDWSTTENALLQKPAHNGQYGACFLHLMLVWAGLVRQPWPYSTITQARSLVLVAREEMKAGETNWGRKQSKIEETLLNLADADAECFLPGGFAVKSQAILRTLCEGSLDLQKNLSLDCTVLKILKARGRCSLAHLLVHNRLCDFERDSGDARDAELQARGALQFLMSLDVSELRNYDEFWPRSLPVMIKHHVVLARRLVADSLLKMGRDHEASQFLVDAVNDAPGNFDATFALGCFQLRTVVLKALPPAELTAGEKKEASLNLLKAARIDTNRADPFAVLGFWYEFLNDHKRAVGCHSKALLLKPCHPISGRGILRVKRFTEVKHLCMEAARRSSSENGWAWAALGNAAAMEDRNDSIAAEYLQRALRSEDIERPENIDLSIFFQSPSSLNCIGGEIDGSDSYKIQMADSHKESAKLWALLAGCYRRMGKYSAALMAFHSADDTSSERLSPEIFCSWGQVELELGLFEESRRRFDQALLDHNNNVVALFGAALCQFQAARTRKNEGKHVLSVSELKNGISILKKVLSCGDEQDKLAVSSICALRLLGDMYSFGAGLSFDAFDARRGSARRGKKIEVGSKNVEKLAFVSQGEGAYNSALSILLTRTERSAGEVAEVRCDLGGNLLLQAQILSATLSDAWVEAEALAMRAHATCKVRNTLHQAENCFAAALDVDEYCAQAWCGLGCSLIRIDPLVSQHCFCRSLQMDKSVPDSWSNLCIFLVNFCRISEGNEILDNLAQLSDTPVVWIERGLLLELMASKGTKDEETEGRLIKAADAYRTALQIAQHPSALLGLALTCRRTGMESIGDGNELYAKLSDLQERDESLYALSAYLIGDGKYDVVGKLIHCYLTLEERTMRAGSPLPEIQGKVVNDIGQSYYLLDSLTESLSPITKRSEAQSLKKISSWNCKQLGNELGILSHLAKSTDNGNHQRNDNVFAEITDGSVLTAVKILHAESDDAMKWLKFARELCCESVNMIHTFVGTAELQASINASVVAAGRARSLFHGRLIHVNYVTPKLNNEDVAKSGTPETAISRRAVALEPVDASEYAESLALEYMLNQLSASDGTTQGNMSHGEDDDVRGVLQMQMALMIDPENDLALTHLQQLAIA